MAFEESEYPTRDAAAPTMRAMYGANLPALHDAGSWGASSLASSNEPVTPESWPPSVDGEATRRARNEISQLWSASMTSGESSATQWANRPNGLGEAAGLQNAMGSYFGGNDGGETWLARVESTQLPHGGQGYNNSWPTNGDGTQPAYGNTMYPWVQQSTPGIPPPPPYVQHVPSRKHNAGRNRMILVGLVVLLVLTSIGGVLILRQQARKSLQQTGRATTGVSTTTSGSLSDNARMVHTLSPQTIDAGKLFTIQFVYENDGTTTWASNNGYTLNCSGTHCMGSTSVGLYGQKVGPGTQCTFIAHVKAPNTSGTYTSVWSMARWGNSFGDETTIKITVQGNASPTAGPTPTPTGNSSLYLAGSFPVTVAQGQSFIVQLTFENNGTTTWSDANNDALVCNTSAANVNCLGARGSGFGGQTVTPGQAMTFTLTLVAPGSGTGSYTTAWVMANNGVAFGDTSALGTVIVTGSSTTGVTPTSVTTKPTTVVPTPTTAPPGITPTATAGITPTATPSPVNNAALVGQGAAPTVQPGQQFSLYFVLQNTGNTTWSDASNYALVCTATCPATASVGFGGLTVAPGQQYQFNIVEIAAATPGTYTTSWLMEDNGVAFGVTVSLTITVAVAATPTPDPTAGVTPTPTVSTTPGATPTGQVMPTASATAGV